MWGPDEDMPLVNGRGNSEIRVKRAAGPPWRGLLTAGPLQVPCALGASGIRAGKREGDGATPRGRFPLVAGYWRPDRLARPRTALPMLPLHPDLGWCDDPTDRNYNRAVDLPYPARHERMWREDHLYDIVLVIGFNVAPVRPGAGSAIFLHLARPDFSATEGCVAVSREVMLRLLARVDAGTMMEIG